MPPDVSSYGVVFQCNQTGIVLSLLQDDLGLSKAQVVGKSFPQLVEVSSLQKALSFLVELRTRGSVFDWEMDLPVGDSILLVHCAGLVLEDKLLIMAARTHQAVQELFDEMMRINNEQMTRLREITKKQVEQAWEQPERDIRYYDELTRLNNELVTLQRELTRKNIELEQLNVEVQRLAITDSLTGLYNRRGFFELSHREVERAKRFGHPFSVIMLDIDHFKHFNDTYGHKTGDQVLETLAARLRSQLRKVDIAGRYGGEEFSILLPETRRAEGGAAAERLRRAVADEPLETDQGSLNVTISVGLAAFETNNLSLEDLLKRADQALYQAKESGRNRVCMDDGVNLAE